MPFVYSYPTSLPAGQNAPSQANTLRSYTPWNETWDHQAPAPQLMAVPLMSPAESTAAFLNNTRMTFQNWVPRVSIPTGSNAQSRGSEGMTVVRSSSATAIPGASAGHQQYIPAVAHTVPGSNVPVVVNPDFDLMVEFGVFDGLPLTDLGAQSPRLGQPQVHLQGSSHAHAHSAPPAAATVQCAMDTGTVISAVSSIGSGSTNNSHHVHHHHQEQQQQHHHHHQEQQQQQQQQQRGSAQGTVAHGSVSTSSGVDACCMTDITYSEALQAFIRRENAV
jgi:hypothetical protein